MGKSKQKKLLEDPETPAEAAGSGQFRRNASGLDRLQTTQRGVPVATLTTQLKKKTLAQADWADLTLFLLFMIVYLVIISNQVNTEQQYYFEAGIQNSIIDEEWSAVPLKTFADVQNIEEWWKWFNLVLIEKVYSDWKKDSNGGAWAYLAHQDLVIAGIEVTQYRSDVMTCTSSRYADIYHTPCQNSVFQVGTEGIYHYSNLYEGYRELFPIFENKATALAHSAKLANETWLDASTRGISVNMLLYNPNINMIGIVATETEIKTSGYVDNRVRIHSVNVEPYYADATNSRYYLDTLFAVMVGGRVVKVFWDVLMSWKLHKKFSSYFKSFWSYLDVLLAILFSCIVIWWFTFVAIVSVFDISSSHNDSAEGGDHAMHTLATPLSKVKVFAKYYMALNAVTVVLCAMRFFGYFRYWGKMSVITTTLTWAAGDLSHFVMFFSIIFLAFAYMGNLLFGRYLASFSTLFGAVQTCFNLALGDFDYDAMRKVEPIGAPLFFWSFVVTVAFTLINMFVAIVSDSYAKVRDDKDFQQSILLQILDSVMNWWYWFGDMFRRCIGRKRRHPPFKILLQIAQTLEAERIETATVDNIVAATPPGYDGRAVADMMISNFGVSITVERSAAHLKNTKNRALQQLENVNKLLTEVIEG